MQEEARRPCRIPEDRFCQRSRFTFKVRPISAEAMPGLNDGDSRWRDATSSVQGIKGGDAIPRNEQDLYSSGMAFISRHARQRDPDCVGINGNFCSNASRTWMRWRLHVEWRHAQSIQLNRSDLVHTETRPTSVECLQLLGQRFAGNPVVAIDRPLSCTPSQWNGIEIQARCRVEQGSRQECR